MSSLRDFPTIPPPIKPIPMTCQTACQRLKTNRFPYQWDLNIYRGCQHQCQYCYAIYSHRYLDPTANFGQQIYYKENIVAQLERQLAAPSWRREIINLGGVTDSYQPAEAELQLMPQILRLLIKYRTPAIICTKSDLVLRDYDLLVELAAITYVNVSVTITTFDEEIRPHLEPGSRPAAARRQVLEALQPTGVNTGLHLMPIVPYLTDQPERLEEVIATAAETQVDYLLTGLMYLRGPTRQVFFNFIRQKYPQLLLPLQQLYRDPERKKAYQAQLQPLLKKLRQQYQVTGHYLTPIKQRLPDLHRPAITQPGLFD